MAYRKNKRREYDDDDGHVIAPMNVPGMPWHTEDPVEQPQMPQKKHDYSKKESFYIIMGSLKAALLIAGFFIAGLGLFILLICLLS